MEIGDWRATRGLNDLYREIRERGLETNVAKLDAFGFTVVEDAISTELTGRFFPTTVTAGALPRSWEPGPLTAGLTRGPT